MAEGFLAAALAALSAVGEIRGITIADNSSNDLLIYYILVVYDISQISEKLDRSNKIKNSARTFTDSSNLRPSIQLVMHKNL